MQEVQVTRRFAAKPQEVWDAYTEHGAWKEWAGIRHSTLEVAGHTHKNGTGAVRCLGSFGFNALERIIDFDPPKRMTYSVFKGGLPMRKHLGEVILEPDGDCTQLIWNCRFDSKVPGLGWLMKLYIVRFFCSALDGLAKHSFPDQNRAHSL